MKGKASYALAVCAACALAAACGSSGSPPSNEVVVASVTRCTEARPPDAATELPIEGRKKAFSTAHPLAQLVNQGGPTLPSPRIVAVYFKGDPLQQATDALLESYGCTPHWRDAVGEYGIGDMLLERSVVLDAYPGEVAAGTLAFAEWTRQGVESNRFGAITDDDVLLFFLPDGVHVLSDDCTARLVRRSEPGRTARRAPRRVRDRPLQR